MPGFFWEVTGVHLNSSCTCTASSKQTGHEAFCQKSGFLVTGLCCKRALGLEKGGSAQLSKSLQKMSQKRSPLCPKMEVPTCAHTSCALVVAAKLRGLFRSKFRSRFWMRFRSRLWSRFRRRSFPQVPERFADMMRCRYDNVVTW